MGRNRKANKNMNYKIGDKVKIIKCNVGTISHEGKIGIVSGIGIVSFDVKINDNDICEAKEIKLLTKADIVYYKCAECDKRTKNVRGVVYDDCGGEIRLCKNCYDNADIYECEDCNDKFDYSLNGVNGGNRSVCNNCFENEYSECQGCSEYYSDTQYCGDCDNRFCNDCYNDCDRHSCNDESDDEYRSVNLTKPIEKNKKGQFLKIDRLVGLELEAENGSRSDLFNNLNNTCGITDDGSLSCGGSEVQTPPRSMKQAEDMIKNTCQGMLDAGFDTDDNHAGLHVHIDFNDHRHDFKMIARLFRTMYAIEDVIYASLRSYRARNSYSVPLKNGYMFSDVKVKMRKNELLQRYYKVSDGKDLLLNGKYPNSHSGNHNGNVRYNGLNLHSVMYRGTVEFRHHEGSLDSAEIIQWVSLLLQIVDYSINRYSKFEVMRILNAKTNVIRFKRMCKFMKLKKETRQYLKERIAKNNPDFLNGGQI